MSGPKIEPSQQLGGWQARLAKEQYPLSQERIQTGLELIQPLIERGRALTSGEPGAIMQAAAPLIGPISQGYTAARENIFTQTAPGAAREYSLGQLEREKASGIAQALSGAAWQAPEQLATVGAGFGQFGLQELGAALSGSQLAGQTYRDVMQAQAAQQQAKLGALGDLLGGAAGPLTKGITKAFKIGGGPTNINEQMQEVSPLMSQYGYTWGT